MGYEINNLYRASYLELPKNKSRERITRDIQGIFTVLKSILILRLVFTYLSVLPETLHNAIGSLSYPLVAPFHLLLDTAQSGTSIDWIALFALAIYSILGFILVKVLRSNIVSAPIEEYDA
jgi:hypothetical protein